MGILNFIKKQKAIRKTMHSKEYREAELRTLKFRRKERFENMQLDQAIQKEKDQLGLIRKKEFEQRPSVKIGKQIMKTVLSRAKKTNPSQNIFTQGTNIENIYTKSNDNNMFNGQGFRNPLKKK
jgi:cystathionine beta-lyase family protein involved in aluminum resistance